MPRLRPARHPRGKPRWRPAREKAAALAQAVAAKTLKECLSGGIALAGREAGERNVTLPIYYVGTPAEVEHHARPLQGAFDVRIVDADEVVRHATPGDVCVFFNEFFERFRLANHQLVRRQCVTLYA